VLEDFKGRDHLGDIVEDERIKFNES